MKTTYFILALCIQMLFIEANAQRIKEYSTPTRDGSFYLQKEVPSERNPIIQGEGKPTKLYVIQLARFEDMPRIPSSFPKGTFLWISPDHPREKLLLVGYYDSLANAEKAAVAWRKNPTFKKAFVRQAPFIIRYD